MSRFFFDFFDVIGGEEVTDAVSLTGAYLKDHPELVGDGFPFGVMVRDDRDRSVCEITVICSDRVRT